MPKTSKRQCDYDDDDDVHCKNPKVDDVHGRANKRPADESLVKSVPFKRCRFKQSLPLSNSAEGRIEQLFAKCKSGKSYGKCKGRPKGTIKEHTKEKVSRDGKSGCISVWKKMEIIQEYERLKKAGTKHVESFMLRNGLMKGGYQGCLSQTKWLGSRSKYKWDVFVKICPELAKKVLEVPNPILDVMGVAASCYIIIFNIFIFESERWLG